MTGNETFADLLKSYLPPKNPRDEEADDDRQVREQTRFRNRGRKGRGKPRRIDLHGKTAADAIEFLSRKLAEMQSGHQEVEVQIIHGKGRRSPDGRPVLKGVVHAWLREQRGRGLVADFRPGGLNEGQEGVTVCRLAAMGQRR